MYTKDRSSLVHMFNSTRERQLNLAVFSISIGLAKNRTVKGYYFTANKLKNVTDNMISISTLNDILAKVSGIVAPSSHNTYYYVSQAKDVLRMDHIANVKQYVSAVGYNSSEMGSITTLTLEKPSPIIGDLCVQLEDIEVKYFLMQLIGTLTHIKIQILIHFYLL